MLTFDVSPRSDPDCDVAWSSRAIPMSYARHVPGQVSWTPPPQSIAVESHLECEIVKAVLQYPDLQVALSQPLTLAVHARQHHLRYTPDLLFVFDPVPRALARLGFEKWTVVEVKIARKWQRQQAALESLFAVVRQRLGFAALCLTDADLSAGRI